MYLTPGIIKSPLLDACTQEEQSMFVHKNTQKSTFLSSYAVTCTAKSLPLGWSLISMDSVNPIPLLGGGGGGGGGVGPNTDRCITPLGATTSTVLLR